MSSDPVVRKPREYLSSECLSSISDIRLSDTLTTLRRQRVKLIPGVTMIVRNSPENYTYVFHASDGGIIASVGNASFVFPEYKF